MTPSHSTLDRLPKGVSGHWEEQREVWEEALRARETVPDEAAVVAISLDGVMAPMKGQGQTKKQQGNRSGGRHRWEQRRRRAPPIGSVAGFGEIVQHVTLLLF